MEHRQFRESARRFCDQHIAPHHERWEREGQVSREVWQLAGQQGLLCMEAPEEYGGCGVKDFRYNVILNEELVRVGASGIGFPLQNDVVLPYLLRYANDQQKRRWLPKMITGEIITAIAMSEPNTGSDLAAVETYAQRSGDHYVLNGQKTFITNGLLHDLVIVVVKTVREAKHEGLSLLVVERGTEGYEKPVKMRKVGMHAQDTAELFFNDAQVPAENLLGEEGQGFFYLVQNLPQERLTIAAGSIAGAWRCLEITVDYCQQRHAFGRPIGKFQNSRFKLAEMKTEIEIGQVFVNRCVMLLNRDELTPEHASMAKWWCSDLLKRVVDQCVQLHGGYGYMLEYPIAKAFLDSRAQTIFGGTNEIMKEIIGRSMGF